MNVIRKLGWAYALMFVAIAGMSYVPAFKDANGMMFGLFSLQLQDDLLHLFSGIWVGVAAWISTRATVMFFKLFGTLYFLDGVLGFFTGMGYLDLGIFVTGPVDLPTQVRFFANAPHLLIGGIAIYIGFVLAKRHAAAA